MNRKRMGIMEKYPTQGDWKKIDNFTVEAPDGSKVWLDIRGLVGLELPSGKYVSFGAYFVSEPNEELGGRKFDSQSFDRGIKVSIEKEIFWSKNGYNTGEAVSKAARRQLLNNIKTAMKTLGCSIEYEIGG